jgi:putative ABC transport system ATP-binding protein
MTKIPVIIIQNLSKIYKMGQTTVKALDELDLIVFEGELVVLLGPSGSGKTTLLNMIGGLDSPTSGKIKIQEKEISGLSSNKLTEFRKKTVGFIFQFYNLIPNLNARENVEFAVELVGVNGNSKRSFDKKDIKEKSLKLLSHVKLRDRSEHFPFQLSGGEQQRVAIARALAKDPQIIIADEPTGNLDYKSSQNVLKVMKDIAIKKNKTVIIVTHNSSIAQTADRILRIRDGKIVKDQYNQNPIEVEQIVW